MATSKRRLARIRAAKAQLEAEAAAGRQRSRRWSRPVLGYAGTGQSQDQPSDNAADKANNFTDETAASMQEVGSSPATTARSRSMRRIRSSSPSAWPPTSRLRGTHSLDRPGPHDPGAQAARGVGRQRVRHRSQLGRYGRTPHHRLLVARPHPAWRKPIRPPGACSTQTADAGHGRHHRRAGRRSRYRLRKQVVEPVFGQIKHARNFDNSSPWPQQGQRRMGHHLPPPTTSQAAQSKPMRPTKITPNPSNPKQRIARVQPFSDRLLENLVSDELYETRYRPADRQSDRRSCESSNRSG